MGYNFAGLFTVAMGGIYLFTVFIGWILDYFDRKRWDRHYNKFTER